VGPEFVRAGTNSGFRVFKSTEQANIYLSKYKEFSSTMIDYLKLKGMFSDIIEEHDLKDITDDIEKGIHHIEKAWEGLYMFKIKLENENLIHKRVNKRDD